MYKRLIAGEFKGQGVATELLNLPRTCNVSSCAHCPSKALCDKIESKIDEIKGNKWEFEFGIMDFIQIIKEVLDEEPMNESK